MPKQLLRITLSFDQKVKIHFIIAKKVQNCIKNIKKIHKIRPPPQMPPNFNTSLHFSLKYRNCVPFFFQKHHTMMPPKINKK